MKADFHNYSTKSFSWINKHQFKKHTYLYADNYNPSTEKKNILYTFSLIETANRLRIKYKKKLLWLICKKYDNYGKISYKLT